jgi:hypothetical protein
MSKNFNTSNFIKSVDTFQRKVSALNTALDDADTIDGVPMEELHKTLATMSYSTQAIMAFHRALRLSKQVKETNEMLSDALHEMRAYTREALFQEIGLSQIQDVAHREAAVVITQKRIDKVEEAIGHRLHPRPGSGCPDCTEFYQDPFNSFE